MKKLWLLCLIVLVSTQLSAAATAADRDPGYYANLGAGYIKVEKVSVVDAAIPMGTAALSAADSIEFVGSLGYLYDSGLRTEFEISFRRNGVDDAIALPEALPLEGEVETDLRTLGGMVNTDACGKGSRIYGRTSDNITVSYTNLRAHATLRYRV